MGGAMTELRLFDYHLPEERIAQEPAEPRDHSRLMVLDRAERSITHHVFRDLPKLLGPADLLVLNDTRVIPARLQGTKRGTGGKAEILLLEEMGGGWWKAMVRPGRRLPPGTEVDVAGGEVVCLVGERLPEGLRKVRLEPPLGAEDLGRFASYALPPYIKRYPRDPERYQTVYAKVPGSVAAPTAGLHFTSRLLDELQRRGVGLAWVTLHVGPGTFRPIRTENIKEHRMHSERFRVEGEVLRQLSRTRRQGGRIVAVGTTVVRVLESIADQLDREAAGVEGATDLMIVPGHRFRAVDALITNFHLPRSTTLVLVAAFAGRELLLEAYEVALRSGYRFLSFGDAMLIV